VGVSGDNGERTFSFELNLRMKMMEITHCYIKVTDSMQWHLLSIFRLYGIFNC